MSNLCPNYCAVIKAENGIEKCECSMCHSVHNLCPLSSPNLINGTIKSENKLLKNAEISNINGKITDKDKLILENIENKKDEKKNGISNINDQKLTKIKTDFVNNSNKSSKIVINN